MFVGLIVGYMDTMCFMGSCTFVPDIGSSSADVLLPGMLAQWSSDSRVFVTWNPPNRIIHEARTSVCAYAWERDTLENHCQESNQRKSITPFRLDSFLGLKAGKCEFVQGNSGRLLVCLMITHPLKVSRRLFSVLLNRN